MEKKLKASNDNRIDYGVILPVFLLCLIGLLSLYVAFEFQMDLETDSLLLWFGVSGNGTLAQIL